MKNKKISRLDAARAAELRAHEAWRVARERSSAAEARAIIERHKLRVACRAAMAAGTLVEMETRNAKEHK